MVDAPLTIEQIHQYSIELLDEAVRICKECNIRYWLAYGTLLGAVRHKGFIPWDDDIDIMLLREDFEKLVSIAEDIIDKDRFCFQWKSTEPHHTLGIARIRRLGTYHPEPMAYSLGLKELGVWIDLYPLDPIDVTMSEAKRRLRKWKLYNRLANYSVYKKQPIGSRLPTIAWRLAKALSGIRPTTTWIRMRDYVCKQEMKEHGFSSAYINFEGATVYGLKNSIVQYDWLKKPCELEFEGKLYSVPCGWHEYLSNMYGDYMVLPPVEKRRLHRFEPPTGWAPPIYEP